MSEKKSRKRREDNHLVDVANALSEGLKTIWKAMRNPQYGWLVSGLVGFFLGVVFWMYLSLWSENS